MLVNRWRMTTVDPLRTVHALAVVRCSDVFAGKFTAPVRSSADDVTVNVRNGSKAVDREAAPPCRIGVRFRPEGC